MAIKLETEARKTRKVLLYGAAKTLKTTTAARFLKPLVIQDALSRGAEFLTGVARTSVTMLDEFAALCGDKDLREYGTVVLDDFSTSVKRWCDQAVAAAGREPRQGYAAVYKRLVPALQQLWLLPANVVITAHHVVEDEFIPGLRDGKMRKWVHPLFPDALDTYLTGIVDVVAYTFNNGRPSALCSESATEARRIVAGHRVGLSVPDVCSLEELVKVTGGAK